MGYVGSESIYKHHDTSRYDSQQADDIHGSKYIEDDVAWSSQPFSGESHGEDDEEVVKMVIGVD